MFCPGLLPREMAQHPTLSWWPFWCVFGVCLCPGELKAECKSSRQVDMSMHCLLSDLWLLCLNPVPDLKIVDYTFDVRLIPAVHSTESLYKFHHYICCMRFHGLWGVSNFFTSWAVGMWSWSHWSLMLTPLPWDNLFNSAVFLCYFQMLKFWICFPASWLCSVL